MLNAIYGTKLDITQDFDQSGKRWPLTVVEVKPLSIVQIKSVDKDGYQAAVLMSEDKKLKKEVKFSDELELKVGQQVELNQVLAEGDLVKVVARSKGRGFTGVMKRWGFKGGPRTHGQSDRERAPGSIGQRTDPGRVWPGKKMAGRSGGQQVTIKNLVIAKIDQDKHQVFIRGLIPGHRKTLVKIKKIGQAKNFTGFSKPKTQNTSEVHPRSLRDNTPSQVNNSGKTKDKK
jgi:large subunit ribosomal protein L3